MEAAGDAFDVFDRPVPLVRPLVSLVCTNGGIAGHQDSIVAAVGLGVPTVEAAEPGSGSVRRRRGKWR